MDVELPIPRTKVTISTDARKLVEEVFESGQFIKGQNAKALGEEFAHFCQAKYGVAASSGSTALLAALMVAGIGPGDEVITVPNTFIATVNAIILAGARPVFADVNQSTFNMDPDSLRSAITPHTKAVIPVHLYGLMAPMPEVMEIATEKDLLVIEDACQAHGAEIDGRRAGSFGDLSAFSFYPTKLLNTAGDGGIVVTNRDDFATKIERFINHGRKSQYEYTEFGFNFRLSEIQAAVARAHLTILEDVIQRRREIAEEYTKSLKEVDGIEPPFEPNGYRHVYYLYVTRARRRDDLIQALEDKQIGATVEYPVVLHQLEYVKSLNPLISPDGLQNSEQCLEQICALPMFVDITDAQIEYIVNSIHEFYS